MTNFFKNLWTKNKPFAIILIIMAILFVYYIVSTFIFTGKFTDKLMSPIRNLTNQQPKSFPPIQQPQSDIFNLAKPDVPEEIGLAMVYPQGQGVGMSKEDSNSFYPGKPGPLLTTYQNPESYGESSLTDPN
jgi:hypothetical protein